VSKEFRSDMRETRYLGNRMTRLVDAKNEILVRNKWRTMEEWSAEDLAALQDLLVDMAAVRERQSELFKIMAADIHLIVRVKRGTSS
jgi:hypothetical protein